MPGRRRAVLRTAPRPSSSGSGASCRNAVQANPRGRLRPPRPATAGSGRVAPMMGRGPGCGGPWPSFRPAPRRSPTPASVTLGWAAGVHRRHHSRPCPSSPSSCPSCSFLSSWAEPTRASPSCGGAAVRIPRTLERAPRRLRACPQPWDIAGRPAPGARPDHGRPGADAGGADHSSTVRRVRTSSQPAVAVVIVRNCPSRRCGNWPRPESLRRRRSSANGASTLSGRAGLRPCCFVVPASGRPRPCSGQAALGLL